MIIAGAGSAGKETLAFYVTANGKGVSEIRNVENREKVSFFDANKECEDLLFGIYPVLKTEEELIAAISKNPDFCVAIGQPRLRERVFNHITSLGGKPQNIIRYNSVNLFSDIPEGGANIIHPGVSISYDFEIGKSCMIHANAVIGHKVKLGNFINISPLCSIIGPCEIGEYAYIAAGSVILPHHKIGKNAIIPAGSIVNRDVRDYETFE
ncbi:MAG: hypothetical protein J6T48_12820 [Bacteroidales bacterium]|nr:hypothetical protein [Bacteroidales bacterium]